MKTINIKLLSLFLLTHLLSGCMPDSLTKFKTSTTAQGTPAVPVIKDNNGNVIDPNSFVYPKAIGYLLKNTPVTTFSAQVGTLYSPDYLTFITDGSLATASRDALFKGCSISGTVPLPSGLLFDSTTCNFSGTPTDNLIVAGNNGQPRSYTITLSFLNVKGQFGTNSTNGANCSGATCTITTTMNIGAYYLPTDLNYTQTDKVALFLSSFLKDIKTFTVDDNDITTRTDVITAQNTGTMGSIQIINPDATTIYALRAVPLKVDSTAGFTVGANVATFDEINLQSVPSPAWAIGDTVTSGNYVGTISYINGSLIKIVRSATSSGALATGSNIKNTSKANATIAVSSIYLYDTFISKTTTSSFSKNDLVTSGSYNGTVDYVDPNKTYIRVRRQSNVPTTLTANGMIYDSTFYFEVAKSIFGSTSTPTKFGKIISKDDTNKIIRVTQSTNYNNIFAAGDAIGATNSNIYSIVNSIDPSDGFKFGDVIDNDTQFYSKEAIVGELTQFYAVGGSGIDPITPIVTTLNSSNSTLNGVTFSISPAVPGGISFNSTTGQLTGTFTSEQEPTKFTLTATNPIGSTSYTFKLAAIYAPKDLSYTNLQLITINNSATSPDSVFYEGENIHLPMNPPSTESITANIIRKFGTNKLAINTFNGSFPLGASIDSGRKYVTEKASIDPLSTTYNYNLILHVADGTKFSPGDYISNSAGALARVLTKDATNPNNVLLFVQFLTPNTSSVSVFTQGEGVDNKISYNSAQTTIVQISSQYYSLVLPPASLSSFMTGFDVTALDTSNAPTNTYISGYIYDADATKIYVSDISRTPSKTVSNIVTTQYPDFFNGQAIDPADKYSTGTTTISSVSNENYIAISRGVPFEIRPQLSQGSSLNYTSDSPLPIGITLNNVTGVISGTAQYLTPKKSYIITAKNLMGSSSFVLKLEVRDYFKIDEVSDSSSYIFHKTGDTQNTRGCQINATDIINGSNSNVQSRDITCYLDGQEEDLHFNPISFKPSVGPGVCEYLQYAPFAFQQYKPNPKLYGVGIVNLVTGDSTGPCAGVHPPGTTYSNKGLDSAGNYTTVAPSNTYLDTCPGNYATSTNLGAPNCDESHYTLRTYSYAIDASTTPSSCKVSYTDSKVECMGKVGNCIQGPIRDKIAQPDIVTGHRSIIYPTVSGFSTPIVHTSPSDHGDYTNLRVANGTLNNACTNSSSDKLKWENYASQTSDTIIMSRPFANLSTPYYVFNCLDAALDIKARVRVVVRDWDRAFKITDSIDSLTPPAKMNDTTYDPFGLNYNRYADWDNAYIGCSDPLYVTQATCLAAGASWTPEASFTGGSCANLGGGNEYQFPDIDL